MRVDHSGVRCAGPGQAVTATTGAWPVSHAGLSSEGQNGHCRVCRVTVGSEWSLQGLHFLQTYFYHLTMTWQIAQITFENLNTNKENRWYLNDFSVNKN